MDTPTPETANQPISDVYDRLLAYIRTRDARLYVRMRLERTALLKVMETQARDALAEHTSLGVDLLGVIRILDQLLHDHRLLEARIQLLEGADTAKTVRLDRMQTSIEAMADQIALLVTPHPEVRP